MGRVRAWPRRGVAWRAWPDRGRGLWHLLLLVLERRCLGCSQSEPRAAMALRAVIFDLDGVLALPSFAGALTSTEEALALPRYGCPVPGAGSCCRGRGRTEAAAPAWVSSDYSAEPAAGVPPGPRALPASRTECRPGHSLRGSLCPDAAPGAACL